MNLFKHKERDENAELRAKDWNDGAKSFPIITAELHHEQSYFALEI